MAFAMKLLTTTYIKFLMLILGVRRKKKSMEPKYDYKFPCEEGYL
jgi:hypothetical protein